MRRNDTLQWTPEEKAIDDARQAVERMPADPRLTACVMPLGEAQNKLADYVDGVPGPVKLPTVSQIIKSWMSFKPKVPFSYTVADRKARRRK